PSVAAASMRVLRVAGPLISRYASWRVTPAPIENENVKTASAAPSGVSAAVPVPTRSTIVPSKRSVAGPGGSDGVARTTVVLAALRLPTASIATTESV